MNTFIIIDNITYLVESSITLADSIENLTVTGKTILRWDETLPGYNGADAGTIVGNAYVNGEFTNVLPKPTEYHSWNPLNLQWEPDLPKALRGQEIRINQLRDVASTDVILYDNKLLQANKEAQNNIQGKLQELLAKQDLAVPIDIAYLFWRDAENNIYTWIDIAAYITWLRYFLIAITERYSLLYLQSWQKKAALEALSIDPNFTAEERLTQILAYDITFG